jgi:hypothetical protein
MYFTPFLGESLLNFIFLFSRLFLLASLTSACAQLGFKKEAEPVKDPLVVLKEEIKEENTVFKRDLEEKLSRMIRNEIVPELREISIYSRRALKKQNEIKNEALQKIIIGRVEWVKTNDPEVLFRARIDTGAQTCSIHAEKITEVSKEGVPYVEFVTIDEQGERHTFLKKIVKTTVVKSTSGNSEKRYVIRLDILFGGRQISTNVNLNNRTHLKHNFLIGRNLLLGDYIVDVSQSRVLDK